MYNLGLGDTSVIHAGAVVTKAERTMRVGRQQHRSYDDHAVDGELVAAALGGDAAAWDALVDRHAQPLWTTVIDHGLDYRHAAQVCAITWLRCADHLNDIAVLEEIGEWLQATAKRECRSSQAAMQRHAEPGAEPNPSVWTDAGSDWVRNGSAPGFRL